MSSKVSGTEGYAEEAEALLLRRCMQESKRMTW
ncbi:hypothetical protein P3T22_006587 [Paraburkholderia sp. GAS348]